MRTYKPDVSTELTIALASAVKSSPNQDVDITSLSMEPADNGWTKVVFYYKAN